ncbi:FAD-binding protein [Microbacterium sp. zg.B48]|uniref:FAD-binding oxidoreductase n=1 Tax=Microbacterium sp. zg.B48 TaxID=2969408 RepID=UPI00214A8BDD|nr:FAD-dependent oxidoreductase [Microbacterium sp. zg.B48]MCR2764277.1 FAD-binding protein [Microbacterium sp. zg.B48]
MELGILLEAGRRHPDDLMELALEADRRGVGVAVVRRSARHEDAGEPWSPWTIAAWIAARTERLRVGIVPAAAPGAAFGASTPAFAVTELRSVTTKAEQSLESLAPGRVLSSATAWVVAPPRPDAAGLRALAVRGIPILPVENAADLDRAVALAEQLRDVPSPPAPRSAESLAARVPGIDYDAVPASLAPTAVEPGDDAYASVSSTYLRGGAPGLVLRPQTVAEVVDAVAFAREHTGVALGIRSAGHGISGRSTNRGGLIIDVGGLDAIQIIDRRTRRVRLGPGATWQRVAQTLSPHGWALGSGDYGGVGVGGLATAGGIGLLSRKHGLTIDRLRAVELVLADGTPVRATETENSDLFWAVRGAGANFGIATAFEFEASEVGEVGWAQLSLVTDDLEASLRRFGQIAADAPRDTTVFLVTGRPREADQFVISLYGVVDDPDPDVVVDRLMPFTELGMLVRQHVVMTPYAGVMGNAAEVGPEGQHGFGEPVSRSAFLPSLTGEFARDAAELLRSGLVYFFELRTMGGRSPTSPRTRPPSRTGHRPFRSRR